MEKKTKQMFIPDYLKEIVSELKEISKTLGEMNNKAKEFEDNADNKETDAEKKDVISNRKKGTKTKRVQHDGLEECKGGVPDESPAV